MACPVPKTKYEETQEKLLDIFWSSGNLEPNIKDFIKLCNEKLGHEIPLCGHQNPVSLIKSMDNLFIVETGKDGEMVVKSAAFHSLPKPFGYNFSKQNEPQAHQPSQPQTRTTVNRQQDASDEKMEALKKLKIEIRAVFASSGQTVMSAWDLTRQYQMLLNSSLPLCGYDRALDLFKNIPDVLQPVSSSDHHFSLVNSDKSASMLKTIRETPRKNQPRALNRDRLRDLDITFPSSNEGNIEINTKVVNPINSELLEKVKIAIRSLFATKGQTQMPERDITLEYYMQKGQTLPLCGYQRYIDLLSDIPDVLRALPSNRYRFQLVNSQRSASNTNMMRKTPRSNQPILPTYNRNKNYPAAFNCGGFQHSKTSSLFVDPTKRKEQFFDKPPNVVNIEQVNIEEDLTPDVNVPLVPRRRRLRDLGMHRD